MLPLALHHDLVQCTPSASGAALLGQGTKWGDPEGEGLGASLGWAGIVLHLRVNTVADAVD